MRFSLPLWFSKPPAMVRYAAGALLAVAAQLARLPLNPPTLLPSITYAPFVVLSASFGGFGAGLVTTMLCVLESMYFANEPIHSFLVADPAGWEGLGALAITGLVASILFAQIQRVRQHQASTEGLRLNLLQEMRLRDRTMESIIQYSPAPIALLSGPDFTFAMVNPAYEALAPGEPMVGRTVAEVWPDAAPQILPLLRIVRDAQTVYHSSELIVPRRRSPAAPLEDRYFNISYVPVPGLSGNNGVAVLKVAVEVTDQKKAEQELRSAYNELSAIYSNAPVILLVIEEDLSVEKLNDRAKSLLGGPLDCLEALANPSGCGRGPACIQCPLRLAVLDSMHTRARHESVSAEVSVPASPGGPPESRHFLVSTAPLPFNHRRKVLVCAQDITELKRADDELRHSVGRLQSALAEKTVLLQEVHHRVKNNLAVISSLLNMKAETTEGADAKLALEESQRRVHSIALIHEQLYESERLHRIHFAECAHRLVQGLHTSHNGESARIAIRLEMDPVELNVNIAMPAGLILNELVCNAFKHAFPGERRGEIRVTFRETQPGHMELAVEDNGVGSLDVLAERQAKSVGLQIVRILTAQLGGTVKQEPGPGLRIVLRFLSGAARRAAP